MTVPMIPSGDLAWYLAIARYLLRVSEKIGPLHKAWVNARELIFFGLLSRYHNDAVHSIRELALWLRTCPGSGPLLDSEGCLLTNRCCTDIGNVMANLLGNDKNPPHCSLKLYVHSDPEPEIVTIGRAQPCNRPPEYGRSHSHLASKNTVFASMLGRSDGKKNWGHPYSSFSCNNLGAVDRFACDRLDWQSIYKSTLAFPLRFRHPSDETYSFIGFLTFDYNHVNGFPGIPCIFEYENKRDEYEVLCRKSAVWNLGASLADTLSLCILPVLNSQREAFRQIRQE